ncbi:MAG: hypothetical protein O9292_02950 [Rhodobacteraceae bacterium]|nr:hypothetical protein [Paracoccaceae bacterium]
MGWSPTRRGLPCLIALAACETAEGLDHDVEQAKAESIEERVADTAGP